MCNHTLFTFPLIYFVFVRKLTYWLSKNTPDTSTDTNTTQQCQLAVFEETQADRCQHIHMNIKVNRPTTDCTLELREPCYVCGLGSPLLRYYQTENIAWFLK
jgi:hypothetical protein